MSGAHPKAVYLPSETTEILTRCYRGEGKRAVIARAVRMLADADGHLTPDGRIKTGRAT